MLEEERKKQGAGTDTFPWSPLGKPTGGSLVWWGRGRGCGQTAGDRGLPSLSLQMGVASVLVSC